MRSVLQRDIDGGHGGMVALALAISVKSPMIDISRLGSRRMLILPRRCVSKVQSAAAKSRATKNAAARFRRIACGFLADISMAKSRAAKNAAARFCRIACGFLADISIAKIACYPKRSGEFLSHGMRIFLQTLAWQNRVLPKTQRQDFVA